MIKRIIKNPFFLIISIAQITNKVIGAAPLPTMTANEAAYFKVLKKF